MAFVTGLVVAAVFAQCARLRGTPTHTEMADTVAELRAQLHNDIGTPLSATPQTVRTRVGSSYAPLPLLGVAVAIGAVAGWCWRGRGMYAQDAAADPLFQAF